MASSFGGKEAFLVKRLGGYRSGTHFDLSSHVATSSPSLMIASSLVKLSMHLINCSRKQREGEKENTNLIFHWLATESASCQKRHVLPDLPLFHPPCSYSFPRSSYQSSEFPHTHTPFRSSYAQRCSRANFATYASIPCGGWLGMAGSIRLAAVYSGF